MSDSITPASDNDSPLSKRSRAKALGFVSITTMVFMGVLLPLATLAYELFSHASADMFFDPIPTPLHVLMVAWVPLANLVTLWCIYQHRFPVWVVHVNGLAIGFAAFYSLMYLPLLPLGVMGIVVFFGLFLLAPLFSLIAAVRLYVRLRKQARQVSVLLPTPGRGILAALVIVTIINLPPALTQIGMSMVMSEKLSVQNRGLTMLRVIGDEQWILDHCYYRKRRSDIGSFFMPHIPPEQAQGIYYRVTGKAFNAQPLTQTRSTRWIDRDEWRNQGNQNVSGKVEQLFLHSSILDGSIAAEADVAYLEWTLVFKNQSYRQAEMRGNILLPPDAVVSRVTLWVEGEEREAAFAGKAKVRKAYRDVVQTRRDPLLVTTSAPDTVLMQMFPVPPQGEMKARIGISVPLSVRDQTTALLRLPHFIESNFSVREDHKHDVWLESKTPLHLGQKVLPSKDLTKERAIWQLSDLELSDPQNSIRVDRGKPRTVVDQWRGKRIQQTVVSRDQLFKNLVLVLDGSQGMQDHLETIVQAINAIDGDIKLHTFLAGDQVQELPMAQSADGLRLLTEDLERVEFEGGMDNVPALEQGLTLARQLPQAAVLWIHAPVPVELRSADYVLHHYARFNNAPVLFDFAVSSGPNRVMEKLEKTPLVRRVARFSSVGQDLRRFFSQAAGSTPHFLLHREMYSGQGKPTLRTGHIVRLWAKDQIMGMMMDVKDRHQAMVAQAAKYQLVTPVSGAVVLENQQQYDRAGLQAVPPGSVPTIPEPEEWAMIVIALLFLVVAIRKRFRFESGFYGAAV